MSDNYYELKNKLSSLQNIRAYVNSDVVWYRHYDVDVIEIPNIILENDIVLETLSSKFKLTPLVIRFDSKKWHRWHVDAVRNVGLNSIVQGAVGHTVFGVPNKDGHYYEIDEVIYKNDNVILLDVTKQHSILNLGEPRVVFTIGFPKTVMYNEVKNFCIENNL